MILYNAFLAVIIVGIAYVIGEWVSTLTRAWVPSVLVTAIIFLIGFWTVIPKTVAADSGLAPFASTIGVLMFITHIGTVIRLKQQYKMHHIIATRRIWERLRISCILF